MSGLIQKLNDVINYINEYDMNTSLFAVELHHHLLGSIKPKIIYESAKRKNKLPKNVKTLQDFIPYVTATKKGANLKAFLDVIFFYLPLIADDEQTLKEICLDFCKQQYTSKIYYTETRLSPQELIGNTLNLDNVMSILCKYLKIGCDKYGIQVRLILSLLCEWNGDNDSRCKEILNLMNKYKYSKTNPCGVVAIDIAGNEAERVALNKSFTKTFKAAKDAGFFVTIHAGEAADHNSVSDAIKNNYADRIGHGYNAVNDTKLLEWIIDTSNNSTDKSRPLIHFECCPTSSVCTNAVKQHKRDDKIWDKHPIITFEKYNIHYSINTDDPGVFQCDMASEINIAKHKLGLTWEQIGQTFINAAQASFIFDKNKKSLLIDIITKRVQLWIKQQNINP